MNKQCIKCIEEYINPDCYQCSLISEFNEKSKYELNKFLNLILFGVSIIIGFTITDKILRILFGNVNFGLVFGLWGLCLCFCIYNLPIKKRVKTH